MAVKFLLRINEVEHEVDCPPDTPLLWVLRDHLGLTGTKYGCGMGQCGACTVHVAGVARRSCVLPVAAVGTRPVTTIERLADTADADLVAAWVEHRVPQCGYCQAGMLMSAASALSERPGADVADLRGSITNVCRCGTYPRILRALEAVVQRRRAAGRGA